jgi:hypothetical protein
LQHERERIRMLVAVQVVLESFLQQGNGLLAVTE